MRTIFINFLFSFLISAPSVLLAQPDTSWFRVIGGDYADRFNSSGPTADGGYILAGQSIASIYDNRAAWLVKTDSVGNVLWSKTFVTEENNSVKEVIEHSAGGYVMVGFIRIPGVGGTDIYAIRTDSVGDTLWTRIFGVPGISDVGFSLVETDEQNIIFCGFMWFEGFEDQMTLIWTDLNGNTLKTRNYGGVDQEAGITIIGLRNGGYLIGGSDGGTNILLFRIDDVGDTLWTKTHSGILRKVIETADGGFAVIGITQLEGAGEEDIYLLKTDSVGVMQFSRTYGGTKKDEGWDIKEVNGSGYIISGWSNSFTPNTGARPYIIRTDALGDTLWTYLLADRWGGIQSIHNTADATYLAAGVTNSEGRFQGGMLMEIIVKPYSIINIAPLWLDDDFDGHAEGVLDGSASYNAEGYEVVGYEWRLDGELFGSEPVITPTLPTGSYTATLTVTDENGYSTTSNEMTFRVAAYKSLTRGSVGSTVTSKDDSLFYAYTDSSYIIKYDYHGEIIWDIKLNSAIQSTLVLGYNDILYVATLDSGIYAFDTDGALLFNTKREG